MLRPLCALLLLLVNAAGQAQFTLGDRNSSLSIKNCKHGLFLLSEHDTHVSKHLQLYGEWAENELQLFLQIVQESDVVLDIGANIGAFTVPLSKRVGEYGRVYAFEPLRITNQRLNANVAINDLSNVIVYHAAVGSVAGTITVPIVNFSHSGNFAATSLADPQLYNQLSTEEVPLLALDSLKFSRLDEKETCPKLIKADVELMERDVLLGARSLLERCAPVLYLENPCVKTSRPLISLMYALHYTPFWNVQPVYNSKQFSGVVPDFEGGEYAINVIGIPTSRLKRTVGDTTIGDVVMLGYERVEEERPYLYQYFDGLYTQAGDENSCGNQGNYYV